MKGTNLSLTFLICGLVLSTAGYPQVESIEMGLDNSDPLLGKDPLLSSPLSGLETLQSFEVFPATSTSILPPSMSSRRTGSAVDKSRVETIGSSSRDVPFSGYRRKTGWEERLDSLGSVIDEKEYQSHLPSRHELSRRSPVRDQSSSTLSTTTDLMGWNGYSPIAPGQSMIRLPASPQKLSTPLGSSSSKGIQLPSQTFLGSQELGANIQGETSDPGQPVSSQLSSQGARVKEKLIEEEPRRIRSREERIHPDMGESAFPLQVPQRNLQQGKTVSGRLRSQSLSSSGGGPSTQSRSGLSSTGTGSISGGSALTAPTLPSRRFHGGNPGESRRPDYTYQYQGTRRYSVGESEYGTGSSYQSLPYYRRRR